MARSGVHAVGRRGAHGLHGAGEATHQSETGVSLARDDAKQHPMAAEPGQPAIRRPDQHARRREPGKLQLDRSASGTVPTGDGSVHAVQHPEPSSGRLPGQSEFVRPTGDVQSQCAAALAAAGTESVSAAPPESTLLTLAGADWDWVKAEKLCSPRTAFPWAFCFFWAEGLPESIQIKPSVSAKRWPPHTSAPRAAVSPRQRAGPESVNPSAILPE